MAKTLKSGLAFGHNKGYRVTPLNLERINTGKKRSFALSEAQILAKNVVAEICSLAPYEKKAIELIKKGNDKRCKKFLKLRLGGMQRTKKKIAALTNKIND